MGEKLLGNHHEGVAVPLGGREDDRVGRRAEAEVHPVELETGGATAGKPEVAEDAVRYALEDPGGPRVVGAGRADIVRAHEMPLSGEPHADHPLRRPVVAPPEAPVLAVEGVVVLARLRRPRANAPFPPADLDGTRHGIAERHPPVEAVAAEVHEAAAPIQVPSEGVEGVRSVVLGMRRGQHDPVGRDEVVAFTVQVVVGHDIELVTLLVQPVEEVCIGREMAKSRPCGVDVAQKGGPEVQHRSELRCEADAAVVGMEVVGGQPVLPVVVGRGITCPPGAGPRPVIVVRDPPGVVPVHGIGEGRD